MKPNSLKVKFKKYREEFPVLCKPVVRGESILECETPTGTVFVNMEETYYVEYKSGEQ